MREFFRGGCGMNSDRDWMKTDDTRKLAPTRRQSEIELFWAETQGRPSGNRAKSLQTANWAELLNLVEVFNLAGFPGSRWGLRNEAEPARKLCERGKLMQKQGFKIENQTGKMLARNILRMEPPAFRRRPPRQNVRLLFAFCSLNFYIFFVSSGRVASLSGSSVCQRLTSRRAGTTGPTSLRAHLQNCRGSAEPHPTVEANPICVHLRLNLFSP